VHEAATIAEADEFFPALETIAVPVQTVTANAPAVLAVTLTLPPEHHINTDAPNGQSLRVDGASVSLPALSLGNGTIIVPLGSLPEGQHEARYTLTLYYCREGNEAACAIRSLQWRVPLAVNGTDGVVRIPLTAALAEQGCNGRR